MKRIQSYLILLAVLFLVSPVFESCTPGDEDPFSLRVRKQRVAGEWIAVKYEVNGIDQILFSDTVTTLNVQCSGGPTTFFTSEFVQTDTTFDFLWDFDVDGQYTYRVVRTINETVEYAIDTAANCQNSDLELSKSQDITIGEWNLAGGLGTVKRKELLVMTDFDLYASAVWKLVRLAKDEIKLERSFLPNNVNAEPVIIKITLHPYEGNIPE